MRSEQAVVALAVTAWLFGFFNIGHGAGVFGAAHWIWGSIQHWMWGSIQHWIWDWGLERATHRQLPFWSKFEPKFELKFESEVEFEFEFELDFEFKFRVQIRRKVRIQRTFVFCNSQLRNTKARCNQSDAIWPVGGSSSVTKPVNFECSVPSCFATLSCETRRYAAPKAMRFGRTAYPTLD